MKKLMSLLLTFLIFFTFSFTVQAETVADLLEYEATIVDQNKQIPNEVEYEDEENELDNHVEIDQEYVEYKEIKENFQEFTIDNYSDYRVNRKAFVKMAQDLSIDEDVTELLVDSFINVSLETSSEDNQNCFPEGSRTILSETLYDFNDVPSAYKYDVYDEFSNYVGYVIVGAQELYAPIIEYGFGESPVKVSERLSLYNDYEHEKTYYVGGIDYIISALNNNGNLVYIDTQYQNLLDSEQVEEIILESIVELQTAVSAETEFAEEWSSIVDEPVEIYSSSSSNDPPIDEGDDPSTPPKDLAPYGSYLVTSKVIAGAADAPYLTMNDYAGNWENHCGPAAGINYLKFHQHVNGAYFSDNTWNSVFQRLYVATNTVSSFGTYSRDLSDGLRIVMREYGFSSATSSWYKLSPLSRQKISKSS